MLHLVYIVQQNNVFVVIVKMQLLGYWCVEINLFHNAKIAKTVCFGIIQAEKMFCLRIIGQLLSETEYILVTDDCAGSGLRFLCSGSEYGIYILWIHGLFAFAGVHVVYAFLVGFLNLWADHLHGGVYHLVLLGERFGQYSK